MGKVTMPEPVGFITDESYCAIKTGKTNCKGAVPIHKNESRVAKTPLFTDDQMEAYAAAKVSEALEWQPIETAPMDGTWVRLWREPETIGNASPEIIAVYNAPTEYVSDGVWMWPTDMYDPYTERGRLLALEDIKNGDFYEDDSFTHWMPLPLSPSTPA